MSSHSSARGKQPRKAKHTEEKKSDSILFDFSQEEAKVDATTDYSRHDGTPVPDKVGKKRSADFEEEDEAELPCGVGNEVQSMLERFGADISKAMQAKKKRVEVLTKNSLKGSQQKLEQLWNAQHTQRNKLTQDYSQQLSAVLQLWETEAHKADEQEEKLNNLFRQQQKLLQQAKLAQSQKLKAIKELLEQFVKNVEELDKSHEGFLQDAQQELKREMHALQKKILMETQQQEMATVRKSLHSMLF